MIYKGGDILLIRTKGIWGYLIRKFTGSVYNHAAIAISDTELIEAKPPVVSIQPLSKWDNCEKLVLRPVDKLDEVKLKDFIESFEGRWYGFLQIIGYIPVLRGKRKRNPIRDGLTCFELLARALYLVLGDEKSLKELDSNTCTGNDLIRYFKNNYNKYVVIEAGTK